MPLVFSPVDQSELRNPYHPRPRSAFLMVQLGGKRSEADSEMLSIVRQVLTDSGFEAVTAIDVRATSDYLQKIIDLIRGCGFGVAVFSDRTPARTLANIFFEVGVAGVLGKPVQLVLTGRNPKRPPAPSDFIRTEWVWYTPGSEDRLRQELRDAFGRIEAFAEFYLEIGQIALDALEPDLELAFERFKQSVLIADNANARAAVEKLSERLGETARGRRGDPDDDMASHRTRLLQTVREFIRLLPTRRGTAA